MGLGEAQRLRDPENEPSEAKPRVSTELKKLLADQILRVKALEIALGRVAQREVRRLLFRWPCRIC